MASSNSTVRTKSKKASDKPQERLRTGVRIQVRDLRVGDKIVVAWRESTAEELTEDQVMDVLEGLRDTRVVAKSKDVREKSECPSQWRTHVHINKTECYDERTYVWVVN